MNSKLVILANGQPMALPDDFSISVDLQNPLFNDTEMFSYPIELPLEGNRHFLKNLDDINSDLRPVNFEHTPMQIIADGIPFASGTAVMQEDEVVDGSLSLNIDASTQSFDDLIADLECRDIPIPTADKQDLKIGEKIGDVNVNISYKYHVKVKYDGKKGDTDVYSDTDATASAVIQPQALGFSYPAVCVVSDSKQTAVQDSVRNYQNGSVLVPKIQTSFINVSDAYGENVRYTNAPPAKFCNARVCYKHYGLEDDGQTSSKVIDKMDSTGLFEDKYPYWVLDANRPQSGICFYVLYFLDCLFEYLGVQFDKSALLAIEDFKHLVFFTTKCEYDTDIAYGPKKDGESPFFNNVDDINAWLSSRGCGGQFKMEDPSPKQVDSLSLDGKTVEVGKEEVASISLESSITSYTVTANILNMYANSKNFPDESVSTIIEALENAFGIKFDYNYEQKMVTAYLVRDVFRKQNTQPRKFYSEVHAVLPISEKITGVRYRYSAESDSKEQKKNIINDVKDYDTDYDYIDYKQKETKYGEHLYQELLNKIEETDTTVYVDLTTGNAYRIKVNADATVSDDLRPSVFEVGQWKGVEYGDCSTINEDFIHDISIDFTPITFNDVNFQREKNLAYGNQEGYYEGTLHRCKDINKGSLHPILAAYVDEDMEHEFVEQRIRNAISTAWANFYFTEILKLVESYDPSDTDDGNSPLQSYDWGTALAVMRGGGSDMTTQPYDYNYDGFGNSKWRTVAGQYALTSDTMDMWGNEYDYNGSASGIGNGERFSLKLRAYKQPEWASEPLCNADVRGRGLFDTFMYDYAYFLINRKKYQIRCTASVAQIADIQNHWKEWWLIDGKKCLINKVSADIDVKDGLGEVELEVYSL